MYLSHSSQLTQILPLLIPIVAIIASFVYAGWAAHLRHKLLMKLAETGQPIPPEILKADQRRKRGQLSPRSGLVLTSIGIGIVLFGWVLGKIPILGAGLIPLLLGLGLFLSFVIERRERGARTDSDTMAPPS